MIEKSCLQKYIEALMTVTKKNGEKVKIDNKTRTVTLSDEGVSFSYWDDNGERHDILVDHENKAVLFDIMYRKVAMN